MRGRRERPVPRRRRKERRHAERARPEGRDPQGRGRDPGATVEGKAGRLSPEAQDAGPRRARKDRGEAPAQEELLGRTPTPRARPRGRDRGPVTTVEITAHLDAYALEAFRLEIQRLADACGVALRRVTERKPGRRAQPEAS